jgi:TolA-binding protein
MNTILAAATAALIAGLGSAAFAAEQQAYTVAMQTTGDAGPPPAEHPQDPADSLYRSARAALNRGDYRRAAELFERITERHSRSSYAPDALYWEAFARYRIGRSEELRSALEALAIQRERHLQAATRRDADALATRIRGELARQGDAQAAQSVVRDANRAAALPARVEAARAASQPAARRNGPCSGDDNDTRIAALNALLQMDAAQAVPILQQVLARRDECSAPLREQAVFALSQRSHDEGVPALIGIARTHPDGAIRKKALFWLGQSGDPRAIALFEEILTRP